MQRPFDCLVGHPPLSIAPSSPQWSMPLPSDRHAAAAATPGADSIVTYGDVFTAVIDFLSHDEESVLSRAAAQAAGRAVDLGAPSSVRIHLVKHGAFYHPCRVTVETGTARITLGVNVAVSDAGRRQLPIEVENLVRLEAAIAETRLPRVYASGFGCAPGHAPFPMFIAQWFEGFHELHQTRGGAAGHHWSVWDMDRPWRLDPVGMGDFFREAVDILTAGFDPYSLSAISDWHHAAGDFVVQKRHPGVAVRLITVRRYAPLFRKTPDEIIGLEELLSALAVFWMRTSMWMRIDRLDGVGELVWAGGRSLAPMWEGFIQGLRRMARRNDFPEAFVEGVRRFFAAHTCEEWLGMGRDILARFPADHPEAVLMARHLNDHAARWVAVVGETRPAL